MEEETIEKSGEMHDIEGGLIYLRARYYEPSTMQFLQQDTYWNPNNMIYGNTQHLVGQVRMPDILAIRQSTNLYAYGANNPVSYIDPSGNIVLSAIASAVIAGALVGAAIGLGGTIARDIWKGELSGWDVYLANTLGGAAGGAVAMIPGSNLLLASATSAVVSNTITHTAKKMRNESTSIDKFITDVLVDTAIGVVAGKFAKALIPRGSGATPKYLKTWLTGKIGGRILWQQSGVVKLIDNIAKDILENLNKGNEYRQTYNFNNMELEIRAYPSSTGEHYIELSENKTSIQRSNTFTIDEIILNETIQISTPNHNQLPESTTSTRHSVLYNDGITFIQIE